MMIKTLPFILLAALASAKNPSVVTPKGMTYNAGSTLDITWQDGDTGFVNIDIVSTDGKTLDFPMMVASGIPSKAGHYVWNIPAELKSSTYQVRVWGTHQPSSEQSEGVSHKFTILNTLPNAVNVFKVLSPNANHGCIVGSTCSITWDYPPNAMHPAMVDVALYRVGNPNPIAFIGTFDSSTKSAAWNVPNDPSLLAGDVYISVSGSGMPVAGPGMANGMGANSQAFMVSTPSASNQGVEGKETKDKEIKKALPKNKPLPPSPAPKQEPKVRGATKKSANNAGIVVPGISAVAIALGLTFLSMYI